MADRLDVKVSSVALQRIIDEVRDEREGRRDLQLAFYNRVYTRHNRS